MTTEEKEIRAAERKAMAEVRRWRREVEKEEEAMTPEEREEHSRKLTEELRARGINVVSSEEHFRRQAEELRVEGVNVVSSVK